MAKRIGTLLKYSTKLILCRVLSFAVIPNHVASFDDERSFPTTESKPIKRNPWKIQGNVNMVHFSYITYKNKWIIESLLP
mmetsp:Transcript_8796/g.16601  ORF Transcript_8796/g.16601 Transcript_8796/m.16601 type:complete len:80 (+) Transcript_8796:323-562(+)